MLLPPAPPAPTEAPSLQNRQIDFRILTQTVVRASTTIVTTITLGTIEPVATETIAVVPLPVHHHGLSGGQIGAILGSVVGVVVLLLIVGFCYVGRRRMPITYEEEMTKKTKRKRRSSSRTTRGIYQYTEEDIYYVPSRKKSSSSRRASVKVEVQEPAAAVVTERIPGAPKFPTYRAIPISNPRNPQVWRSS
ncbi:hypothetical protein N5P37_001693 [Trichoderma harzianum]|nr:hypothetical protein N5P37_001693 [Trichoderma harzianum]